MTIRRDTLRGATVVSRVTKLKHNSPADLIDYPSSHRFLWKRPLSNQIFLGLGSTLKLQASGIDRAEKIRQQVADLNFELQYDTGSENFLSEAKPRFIGGLSFYADHEITSPWESDHSATFNLPIFQILKTKDTTWLTINRLSEFKDSSTTEAIRKRLDRFESTSSSVEDLSSNEIESEEHRPRDADWKNLIEDFTTKCRYGPFQKIVPAQHRKLELSRPVTLPELYQNFTVDNPKTYRFIFQNNDMDVFVGASPEQLLSLHGQVLETESIAGTIKSVDSEHRRKNLAEELSESQKDLKEHDHVVDYLRNKLLPLTTSLESVPRSVRTFSKIQHLVTALKAKLKSNSHVLTMLDRLHPTPAVCGRPSGVALNKLQETESFDRGFYAAPLGWFDSKGNGEFTVAIRSSLIRGDTAHTFAGAGIITESQPEDELEELQLKFDSIHSRLLSD